MHKILVVEDEIAMADVTKAFLTKNGFKVSLVSSAEEAFQKLRDFVPDLLILDLGLPGMSGIRFCEVIRQDPLYVSLPIIMLTNKKQESSKVDGLTVGADDYVLKPFSEKELLARIGAVMRRSSTPSAVGSVMRVGKIEVNLDAHEVRVGGKPLELYPKEYDILVLLMKRKGMVIQYNLMAESVWGDERIATRQDIKGWVSRLRDKLGTAGSCIETVTNQGYKLVDP